MMMMSHAKQSAEMVRKVRDPLTLSLLRSFASGFSIYNVSMVSYSSEIDTFKTEGDSLWRRMFSPGALVSPTLQKWYHRPKIHVALELETVYHVPQYYKDIAHSYSFSYQKINRKGIHNVNTVFIHVNDPLQSDHKTNWSICFGFGFHRK